MAYFPMFVDLTDKPCLVVGGGNVAYRKVLVLRDFGARVIVVAEDICGKLQAFADGSIHDTSSNERNMNKSAVFKDDLNSGVAKITDSHTVITIKKKKYEPSDCDGMTLVVAATDDKALNHDIAQYCKLNNIMINAVDQKEDCSFIFSSYVKEQNLVAAFSSGGNSPVLTQYLKEKERGILTPFLGELNEYMGQIREAVFAKYETEEERKRTFKEIVCAAIDSGELPD